MKEKHFLKSRKLRMALLAFYVTFSIFLGDLVLKSAIFQRLIAEPEAKEIFQHLSSFWILFILGVLACVNAIFMRFIYRNLLKFFFTESNAWQSVDFCYLLSVICGTIVSIFFLLLNQEVNIGVLNKATNITALLVLNGLFYALNRKMKEQVLVAVISIANAGIVFFV